MRAANFRERCALLSHQCPSLPRVSNPLDQRNCTAYSLEIFGRE